MDDEASGVTDCEDFNVDENDAVSSGNGFQKRMAETLTPFASSSDGKTDVEYLSGEDALNHGSCF